MWSVGWRIAFIDNYVCESLVYYRWTGCWLWISDEGVCSYSYRFVVVDSRDSLIYKKLGRLNSTQKPVEVRGYSFFEGVCSGEI